MIKDIFEKIEKHTTLNPKLFDKNNHLKEEVRDRIIEIVENFLDGLKEDGINIEVDDIVILGSNASYNYTDSSDLDVHIIADTASLNCPDDLYPLLYSAYRTLFNNKLDISFYGIPVELYVEIKDAPAVSNGVYSVRNGVWIKEPEPSNIPDINYEEVDAEVAKWKKDYDKIIKDKSTVSSDRINEFISDIYDLRQSAIEKEGEYGIGNLVFKEFRNRGYLDKLKDLKNIRLSSELSLESLQTEKLTERYIATARQLQDWKLRLQRATHEQPLVQQDGKFEFFNIDESDIQFITNALRKLQDVKNVSYSPYGFNFHKFPKPTRLYTVRGEFKTDNE